MKVQIVIEFISQHQLLFNYDYFLASQTLKISATHNVTYWVESSLISPLVVLSVRSDLHLWFYEVQENVLSNKDPSRCGIYLNAATILRLFFGEGKGLNIREQYCINRLNFSFASVKKKKKKQFNSEPVFYLNRGGKF